MRKFCKVLVVFNEAVEAYCRKAVEMRIPLDYGVWNRELMWLDEKKEPHVVRLDDVHHIECGMDIYPDLVKSVSPTKVYDYFLDKDDPDYYDQTDNVIDRMYEGCDDLAGRTLRMLDLLSD